MLVEATIVPSDRGHPTFPPSFILVSMNLSHRAGGGIFLRCRPSQRPCPAFQIVKHTCNRKPLRPPLGASGSRPASCPGPCQAGLPVTLWVHPGGSSVPRGMGRIPPAQALHICSALCLKMPVSGQRTRYVFDRGLPRSCRRDVPARRALSSPATGS